MKIDPNRNPPLLALAFGEVLTLDDAKGTCIEARRGVLWVTEEGDREDRIVNPGEVHVVRRSGRTLVQAMRRATVFVRKCQRALSPPTRELPLEQHPIARALEDRISGVRLHLISGV